MNKLFRTMGSKTWASHRFLAPVASSLAACTVAILCGSAQAASTYDASTGILKIKGTGEGLTPATSSPWTQDKNWSVIALPTSPAPVPAPPSIPYALYIPSSTPPVWYPGSNTANVGIPGVGSDSTSIYRWGTPQFNGTGSSFYIKDQIPGNPTYSYVVSTDFTVEQAGTYTFFSNMSGDNRVAVYLGGTPSATSAPFTGGTTNPFGYTISGGQLLAATIKGPAFLQNDIAPNIALTPGTYTLNYLVYDFYTPSTGQENFGATGLFVSTTYFKYNVPGPLPLLGAGAFFAHSRRLRRRVKSANSALG